MSASLKPVSMLTSTPPGGGNTSNAQTTLDAAKVDRREGELLAGALPPPGAKGVKTPAATVL